MITLQASRSFQTGLSRAFTAVEMGGGGGGGLPLEGWSYRKSVTLSRASGAVTNYQMRVLIGESAGATGEDVDCGGHCLSNFNDLRFTKSDGATLLDYWIESITGTSPNQLATVWVEFDSIGTGATTFYMYYGNAGAAAASSGANTFLVFDDFSGSDLWANLGGATHSVSGGVMACSDSGSEGVVYKNVNLANGYAFRFVVTAYTDRFSAILNNDGSNVVSGYLVDVKPILFTLYKAAGAWSSVTQGSMPDTLTAPFTIEIRHYGGNTIKVFLDGVEKASFTDSTTTTGRVGFRQVASRNKSVDNVIVRQFLATEPAWGSWGAEES